jgi:hypothetical protein
MNDLYSHKLFYQVTEKIYTILKVNVQEQNILGRRGRDLWELDLQLHIQSVYITTDVVSSNLDQGEVHNIMW